MRFLTLLAAMALSSIMLAEHLPGGNISVRCVSGNQHEVTLKLWRECTGAAMIGQTINFVNTCGVSFSLNNMPLISVANVSPVCEGQADQTTCDGGPFIGIEEYTYRTTVNLSPCNFWRIYWSTCCRFPALNLQGSQGIYVEALVNNLGGTCNEYPTFSDNTPPLVCVNQPVSYDPGVLFTQGQDLRFRLINARRLLNSDPQNLDIQSVTYQSPFTGPAPYTGLAIDSITGQISFTPLGQGYIVCVIAIEVRDAGGVWRGTIMRDFPFIAQACDNNVPDAASGTIEDVSGEAVATAAYALNACGSACFSIAVADADGAQSVSLTSNIGSAIPGAEFIASPGNPATASICIGDNVPEGSYLFTVTATDDACPVIGTQVFTYVISVSASAEAGADATIPLCPGETIDLTAYVTGDNGGIWSDGPIVSGTGTYTYTITGSCGEDEAVFEVVQGSAPNAGEDAEVEICAGGAVNLSNYLTGDAGGVWSEGPQVGSPGEYTYTVSTGCGSDEAVFTVVETTPPNAGGDNTILVCPQADAFALIDSLLGTPDADGAWFFEENAVPGTFDPLLDPEGDYCYVVEHPQCGTASACVRIALLPQDDPYCISLGVLETEVPAALHPNPTDGLVFIRATGTGMIEAIDASGRMVWSAPVVAGTSAITLPGSMVNGSYAMRITRTDGTVTVQRFELLR
ncbi:MAG TPA: hypothetical protein PKY96_09380 [Flavobacteriales bacterium]|nr:hypothetical protein [Flavobacteriales bacterium]